MNIFIILNCRMPIEDFILHLNKSSDTYFNCLPIEIIVQIFGIIYIDSVSDRNTIQEISDFFVNHDHDNDNQVGDATIELWYRKRNKMKYKKINKDIVYIFAFWESNIYQFASEGITFNIHFSHNTSFIEYNDKKYDYFRIKYDYNYVV